MGALTDDEKRDFININVESDLSFLWSESDVILDLQYRLGHSGFTTLRKFVGLEDSKPLVRAALIADFALDQAAAAGNRLILASTVSAWEIATQLLAKETQIRAEAKASNMPRPLTNQEQVSMRRVVEQLYGPIPMSENPSSEYLGSKVEEVESNAPTASRLDEVTSLLHCEAQTLTATVGPNGSVTVLHKKAKTSMPSNPEQLRMRLRVEAHLWVFLLVKFSNRPWLVGITPQIFSRYCDHFLGEKCNAMLIPSGSSGEDSMRTLNPPWAVVLNYEFACRRTSFIWVREKGMSLKNALELVVSDAELKEIHFTSPIALMPTQKRQQPDDTSPRPTKSQRRASAIAAKSGGSKGSGAGKGRGKGSKGKGKGKNLMGNTPDGRQICFAFNSEAGCAGNCERAHACRRRGCNQEHSILACTMASSGP